ncbi:potassium transporter Kup [Frigidibacter sp. RF13]|uniref:potassium transporter Kup n=1 Tax=Frigidibacter sp. RF13 TaxID=2997340 RepID=UPI00226EB72F|nr:potassium transporter Kup [Frigidibacter sp. RF13]MCY1128495.1 potassium transporter Kup [Frigidibacter sp. RF13]
MSNPETALAQGSEDEAGSAAENGHGAHKQGLAALTMGAIGVVYGDIGTSPLYAMREALHPVSHDGISVGEVLGVVSLLIWTLILIVTVKYVLFLLRADNRGEGGILALYTLSRLAIGRRNYAVLGLGIAGAALFFGDAVITPAVSVLSAVEGIKLVTPKLDAYVLPITVGILVGLFMVQRHGTQAISAAFGPITALWFLTMATTGAMQLAQDASVVAAFNPYYGIVFLVDHGLIAFIVMGAVFLAVTGAEALYADLGHFGKRPIRLAWFILVFPALVLNYLGQGSLVLRNHEALENPFFLMVPDWFLPLLVALATVATIIASQAVITGAFSMTRAAIQLGFLPRLSIVHTSESQSGQIYVPAVNWLLLAGVLLFVLNFRTSSALAAAYGISVTGAMIVDTTLAMIYARKGWNKKLWVVLLAATPFLLLEGTFFLSNMTKFFAGGFVPVVLSATISALMYSWWRGTQHAVQAAHKQMVDLDSFARSMMKSSVHVVPGTAFFLTSDPNAVPPAMLHNIKHNRVLHERNVILTVETVRVPIVSDRDRAEYAPINERFGRLILRFGFMESPNISRALGRARREGLRFDVMTTSFFLGRRKVVLGGNDGLRRILDRLFIALGRFSADPSEFYQLPRDRVVELGARISI